MNKDKISIVSPETLNDIIRNRSVLGLFLALEPDAKTGEPWIIACDNSDAEAYVEEFRSLWAACGWLRGETDAELSHINDDPRTGVAAGKLEQVQGWLKQMDDVSKNASMPALLRTVNQCAAETIRKVLDILGLNVSGDREAEVKDRLAQAGRDAILGKYVNLLTGRNRGDEISLEEVKQLEHDGVVFLFGYSDDCAEFVGAINEELGAYDPDGEPVPVMENPDVNAIYQDGCWRFDSKIPAKYVDIYDGNFLFCRAILFMLSDAGKVGDHT